MIVLSVILPVVLSSILLLFYFQARHKLITDYKTEYYLKHKQYFEQKLAQLTDAYKKESDQLEKNLNERKHAVNQVIEQLDSRTREAEMMLAAGRENIESELAQYRDLRMRQVNDEIQRETQEQKAQATLELSSFLALMNQETEEAKHSLSMIRAELDDFKARQTAVNEEIRRRREVQEKIDFYRIKLSNEDKQDIQYLLSIIKQLRNPIIVYKLIWTEYLQKPFSTMTRNVVGGQEIKCVIYKITNQTTGEVYIGKTRADVVKRWTEHLKTSLNIGTVARSRIHLALLEHWDEFTFEVLEQVSDEARLSEREKYYINFYQSNVYGYNMNSGG